MPKTEGEKRRRRRRQKRLRGLARIQAWTPPPVAPLQVDQDEAELLECQRELLKEITDGHPAGEG